MAKRNVDYHTQVLKDVDVKITQKIDRRDIGGLKVNYGEVEVSEDFYKYKIMNYRKVLGTYPLDLAPLKFRTRGVWFTLPHHSKKSWRLNLKVMKYLLGAFMGLNTPLLHCSHYMLCVTGLISEDSPPHIIQTHKNPLYLSTMPMKEALD